MLVMFRLITSVMILSVSTAAFCFGIEVKNNTQCHAIGQVADKSVKILLELQNATEKGEIYIYLANKIGVQDCYISEKFGLVELRYQFKDGSTLLVERNELIEYSMNEVQFANPLTEEYLSILKKEVVSQFGIESCNINWQNPDVKFIDSVTVTVYRGEICNCNVSIRRDAGRRVIGLKISSAC